MPKHWNELDLFKEHSEKWRNWWIGLERYTEMERCRVLSVTSRIWCVSLFYWRGWGQEFLKWFLILKMLFWLLCRKWVETGQEYKQGNWLRDCWCYIGKRLWWFGLGEKPWRLFAYSVLDTAFMLQEYYNNILKRYYYYSYFLGEKFGAQRG